MVQQGELLIEIDPRDYQLDVQRLEEELKQAVAMIRELEIEIQNAENQKGLTEQQLEIDRRQLERNPQLSTTAAASQGIGCGPESRVTHTKYASGNPRQSEPAPATTDSNGQWKRPCRVQYCKG